MSDGSDHAREFSLASARKAAREGVIDAWVQAFLSSPGSDNELLALGLAERPHRWAGPLRVPLGALERLAGPEPDATCRIEADDWRADVERIEESLQAGWEPPPLIAEYQDDRLLLHDGNHRYEALVEAGETSAWTLVFFAGSSD
jgi:hypothetical protein